MNLHELAVETAEKQEKADSKAFENVLCPFITADILIKAAETIDRLGKAAQDCKSCARLPECNAYKDGDSFENCDYKWIHADEVRRICDETLL